MNDTILKLKLSVYYFIFTIECATKIVDITILKNLNINIISPRIKININVLWSPFTLGWIKGNTNDVAKGTPSLCACGSMFRNANGDHVGSFSFFVGKGNSLLTKFMGVIMAMEVEIDKNWDNIWIESNSINMVRALHNTNPVPWSIKSH